MQVVLDVFAPRETKRIVMEGSRFAIGRSPSSDLPLQDDRVSAAHATVYREGDRAWLLDEGSVNGTIVDGKLVPPTGVPLKNNSEITIGDTTIVIHLESDQATVADHPSLPDQSPKEIVRESSPVPLVAGVLGILLLLLIAVVVASYALGHRAKESKVNNDGGENSASPTVEASPVINPTPTATATVADNYPTPVSNGETSSTTRKLYLQMTPQEQMDFIDLQARHISLMMGNRPYTFNDDVLRYIKQYVDGYAKRVGNNSTKLWAEDMRFMFGRAREQYAPYIIRAFNARGVPPVVGLYLVVVETEYHNIQSENAAGAAGLFQFIGPTARGYGVEPSERTNVTKMAPAAAAYMADRIAEFGPDSMSVALGIAGYNRSPDSVRRDLQDVLNSDNRERSFWTLVANSNKLDRYFQGENIKYVPKFFAAAIIGETPWAFGIQMQPLSTYTEIKAAADTADAK